MIIWYGGGYYWGYPPYYGGYSYSYTTGTVIIAMADQKNKWRSVTIDLVRNITDT
ncbi:MAG: hypothetical protein R3A12_19975 [Ignavibacteria bacterium]